MSVSIAETWLKPAPAGVGQTEWYQRAVIYELHVRAFHDSDGNGAGDFAGLIRKLDYIQDLGVTAIWLLPFCPSPWKDDGYDISDYLGVHPAYGCIDDFRELLDECKRRDLRVITELVLNHTSDQHPWFQQARRSEPGSRARNYYVWSDNPDAYKPARVIFKDFEVSNWTWDPVAKAYYWHRFFSHQPDLNYASADVRDAVKETVDFWFGLGVDGLRLDAVPYLCERENTTCENLPETHEFLRELRAFVDSRYSGRMLLAEANQWPEDAVAYFGNGDECHMAFNFPLMPRLFMATRMEDSFPVVNIVRQTPQPPPGCCWATFLRNHDELTLEMVCDEEREYMYSMYAQDPATRINLGIRRRLAPLLQNDRRLIRLMNALLFSLPGTPVIYYGDEIGMGDDLSLGDRNGVRTPMQWSGGLNAGFSTADPATLYLPVIADGEFAHDFVNVEAQLRNRHSLLWWMRHALSIRRDSEALTAGDTEFLTHRNRHVLAFLRQSSREDVLVVANLSRYAQPVQLPLAAFAGRIPVEVFGRVEFPVITAELYQLSLSPHSFFWFELRKPAKRISGNAEPVELAAFQRNDKPQLARLLAPHLHSSDVTRPRETTQVDILDVADFKSLSRIVIARVSFTAGDPEVQLVPLTIAHEARPGVGTDRIIGRLMQDSPTPEVVCIDASEGTMSNALVGLMSRESGLRLERGELRGCPLGSVPRVVPCRNVCLLPNSPSGHQRNTSVLLSDLYVLKLFRQLDAGTSPEMSTVRFLFEEAGFSHVAPVFGKLMYVGDDGESFDIGVLQAYADNRADLWQITIDELSLYLEHAAADDRSSNEFLRNYLELCCLLGRRTAEMHLALSGAGSDYPEIAPEPFDAFSLRGSSYAMTSLTELVGELIEQRFTDDVPDPEPLRIALRKAAGTFRGLTGIKDVGMKLRTHGDFHLGQVLHTGEDLVFIDFEGDNSRPLTERLIKTSPLADIASMIHSFRYAAASIAHRDVAGPFPWHDRMPHLKQLTNSWFRTVTAAFLGEYRARLAGSTAVPSDKTDYERLLQVYLLAKAVYQLAYELRHRPDWIAVASETFLEIAADTTSAG